MHALHPSLRGRSPWQSIFASRGKKNGLLRYATILALFSFISFVPTSAGARDFPSPDGTLIARTNAANNQPTGESTLQILNRAGNVLLAKSYVSPDGQHGEVIDQAAWTPNSEFFVFSMYSSGGHQPWFSPTSFYSRKLNALLPLDGPELTITDPKFQIVPPNSLKVFVLQDGSNQSQWVQINLAILK
jgi:hypothetical protein